MASLPDRPDRWPGERVGRRVILLELRLNHMSPRGWWDIKQKYSIKNDSEILFVPYWNNTVPSIITSECFEKAKGVLAWAMTDSMSSAGLVLLPVHSYKLHQLHLEEDRLLNALKIGLVNIDHMFSVPFKELVDTRDHRPAVYMGRFVFAAPLGEPRNTAFGSSTLFRKRRVEETPQMAAKSMREIEDLDPSSLPNSIDSRDGLRGPGKYAQIGSATCANLLHGVLISE